MSEADQVGTSGAKSIAGKVRVRRSAVHSYFDRVDVEHPKTKKIVEGTCCTLCKEVFLSIISTNLKNHSQHKHPEAYELVLRKYKLSLFCVKSMFVNVCLFRRR